MVTFWTYAGESGTTLNVPIDCFILANSANPDEMSSGYSLFADVLVYRDKTAKTRKDERT